MDDDPADPALFRNRTFGARSTAVSGVLVFDLVVTEDGRGWSKTNFGRETFSSAGLPASFVPTRWCANFNRYAGVTRGIHAELTNKLVSLSQGSIWAAIVDLREGPTFGTVATVELTAGMALYIPLGCGNSYQTRTDAVHYAYVADDNVGADAEYLGVNLADPTLAIPWPVPLSDAILLPDDRTQPWLDDVRPIRL